jgi:hypothetical protein
MNRPAQLIKLAQGLASERPPFFIVKGPGHGDRDTAGFMAALRERSLAAFGSNYSEHRLVPECGFTVDYWFPEEGAVVEVALSLRNPLSEFERDIFKVLLARSAGIQVSALLFISKPGARIRCAQPGARSISMPGRTSRSPKRITGVSSITESAPAAAQRAAG